MRSRRNNRQHSEASKTQRVTSRPASDHVLRATQRPLSSLSRSRDTADQFN